MDYFPLFEKYVKNLDKGSGKQRRGNCPFHSEKTKKNKSFCINMETGQYHCKGCPAKGNAITFAKHFGESIYPYHNYANLGGYQKLEIKNIAAYHKQLLDNLDCAPRFWNIDIIKLLKVGWDIDKSNFVFPISNDQDKIINVRHHKGQQFRGARASLYPLNIVNTYDDSYVTITEGEKDVVSLLSNGIQAVTSTGGATAIPNDISALMRFKNIYLCLDNDPAGDAGIDLWIKRLKEMNPKSYVRVCDLSDFVDEGGDVTDYFSLTWKSGDSFLREVIDRSLWAKMPGTDVPDYLSTVMLSDKVQKLPSRLKIILLNLILRATRYRVITSKINGMRVRMKPGEYITTYPKLAELCDKNVTPKMVRGSVEKLVKLGLIRKQDLKMKRGMKFTLIGWIDGNGHSKSHSNPSNKGIHNIKLSSTEELISRLKKGHSKS